MHERTYGVTPVDGQTKPLSGTAAPLVSEPAVQVDAPLPPMPDPKYIYHVSPLDGEDDLFEFRESGAVDEGCEHCERLYTGEQIRQIVLADRRQRAAEQPDTLLRKERQAIVDLFDEYIPPNGEAWDAVNEIRTMMKERADK